MSYEKALEDMMFEVRELNHTLGWRPSNNTFGDYIALLHSEVSEMLEAFRTWKLVDATEPWKENAKPEGIGSEAADVFIRLLDMCDVFGIDLYNEYTRKMKYNYTRPFRHGGRTL